MASLRETQELFWKAITWPTGVEAFLESTDDATRARFARTFTETTEFPRSERVDVYANAYFWRMHDVLAEQFPTLAWLTGAAQFRNLVTDYVLRRPSIDPDIRQYGRRLPAFVRHHTVATSMPALGSVAEAEWTLTEVLDGPDEPALEPGALGQQPADSLVRMSFDPTWTTRLLDLDCDFVSLCQSRSNGDSPPSSTTSVTRSLLVYRKQHAVHHRNLHPSEAVALRATMAGKPFVEICARTIEHDANVEPGTVAGWLMRWLEDGLLRGGRG